VSAAGARVARTTCRIAEDAVLIEIVSIAHRRDAYH
jgi:hypothetical protein